MKTLLLLLLMLPVVGEAQDIITIAGNGSAGYSGNNGAALSVELNHPDIVRFDHSGNMYVADEHNNVIRKINTSGIITTIAGTGTSGYSGDGGQATNAELNRPSDLMLDVEGNLYISELLTNTIRKITTTGIITTIAGTGTVGYSGDNGPATNAQLWDPFGLVFDNSGNLYFGDNGNAAVRKINTFGIISTVAGTGISGYSGDNGPATDAQLSYTGYITLDTIGNIYIADYANHRVRKVDASGIITTLYGNSTAEYSGDGGPATNASFVSPYVVIFDQSGNMYISDRVADVIRKVNTSGIITTVAGNDTTGYSGDGGPATAAELNIDVNCSAIDAGGNLFIADPNNNRIRRVTYNAEGVNNINKTPKNISIYPNPVQAVVTIKSTDKIESIEILNLIWQEVASPRPSFGKLSMTGEREVSLSVSLLPGGVYFVKVNGVYAGKFVKE